MRSPIVGATSAAALPATSARSQRRCASSRPASARASSSRSPTSRLIRREERSAESTISRSSSWSASLERGLQQLEVGEDAGQRRAQLVRGVGDELALLLHRPLALGAGGVERAQHLLQGHGQLADLVVGARLRHVARGVAGGRRSARAVAVSEAIGRIARPAIATPARLASRVAAEHAGGDEQPEPVDGRVDVLLVAAVLDVAGDAAGLAAA